MMIVRQSKAEASVLTVSSGEAVFSDVQISVGLISNANERQSISFKKLEDV